MYCYRCGQRLAEGIHHCPNCGAEIFYDESGSREGQESRQEGSASGSTQNYSYDYSYRNDSAQNTYNQNQYQSGQYNQPYNNYNNYNGYQPPQMNKADTYALVSLILSICAMVCCCIPYIGLPAAIAGVIFGILGRKAVLRKNMALAGLIVSIIALLINGFLLVGTILALQNPEFMANYAFQLGESLPIQ